MIDPELKDYTESLVAFLKEKLKEYQQRGAVPTIETLVAELEESLK